MNEYLGGVRHPRWGWGAHQVVSSIYYFFLAGREKTSRPGFRSSDYHSSRSKLKSFDDNDRDR